MILASWKESCDKPRQCIKKQRNHFANKGPYNQSFVFSVSCMDVRVRLQRKSNFLSAKELMLLNCGAEEDSGESLGL